MSKEIDDKKSNSTSTPSYLQPTQSSVAKQVSNSVPHAYLKKGLTVEDTKEEFPPENGESSHYFTIIPKKVVI